MTTATQTGTVPIRAEAPRKEGIGHILRIKGLILGVSLATLLICFLLLGFLSKNQLNVDLIAGMSGLQVLTALFTGGVLKVNTAEYGKKTVELPMAVPVLTWLCTAAILAAAALLVVRYVWAGKREQTRLSAALSGALAGAGILLLATYFYLLFCNVTVQSFENQPVAFYRVFEVQATPLLVGLALVVLGLVEWRLKPAQVGKIKRYAVIYAFIAIPLALILIFNLYPVYLQTILSFKDYKLSDGIFGSEWVGMKQFAIIFSDAKMLYVIGNTLYISLLRLFVNIVPPLILSIFLYDLRSNRLRSVIQNIVYIPHFFSWVIIYAIAYAFFSSEGLLNSIAGTDVEFLVQNKYYMPIVIGMATWKELGWGTILYMAALTGVDTSLFEAAKIDGAGPLQRIFHITLPNIKNIIIYLTIMSLGNILKGAGGEQLLLFYSSTTKDQSLVIDTWLYWESMGDFKYSLGAAMSFFQAAIGLVLVLSCNAISKKTTGVGMW